MNPYKIMKRILILIDIFLILIDIFIVLFFCVIIVSDILANRTDNVLRLDLPILFVVAVIGGAIESILILYFRALVMSVDFSGEDVIINTYHKAYPLPGKFFTEVKEDEGILRTIIRYNDGKKRRIFIYPMRFCPFSRKRYYLDLNELRKHMPNARIKERE